MDFSGQVAIVTGAGSGLGKAYALWLAARGAAVVVNNRKHAGQPSSAAAVVAEIVARGGRAVADEHSVEDPKSGKAMVKAALDNFGRVDILICNAAVHWLTPFSKPDLSDFRQIMDINFWGTVYPLHAAWRVMLEQGYGRIVLTSSTGGVYGTPDCPAYSASKASMIGLARALTVDVPAGADIKINVLSPGAATKMLAGAVPSPNEKEALQGFDPAAMLAAMHVDKVAPAAAWLASKTCNESGMMLFAVAGRVSRVRVVEGAVVEIPDEDFNIDWARLNATDNLVEEKDVLASLAKLLK